MDETQKDSKPNEAIENMHAFAEYHLMTFSQECDQFKIIVLPFNQIPYIMAWVNYELCPLDG